MGKPDEILQIWLKAVNEGNLEKVLSLYNENAILIPTFSNKISNTSEKIRNYFNQLKSREGLQVNLHENTIKQQRIDENVYALCGIYNWKFFVEDELLIFEARFSFLINLALKSPILHHHSSQIPRTL